MKSSDYSRFQDRLLRNPGDPVPFISLLALWVASADGTISPEEKKLAEELVNHQGYSSRIIQGPSSLRKPIQLTCELLRSTPEEVRIAVLVAAIKVAAIDQKITSEENLVLRFLGDVLCGSEKFHAVYRQLIGQNLPELSSAEVFLSQSKNPDNYKHRLKLILLIARLRCELMLPDSPWWNGSYQQHLGNYQRKGSEQVRLLKRSKSRKIEQFLIKGGVIVATVFIVLLYLNYDSGCLSFQKSQP